MVTDAGTAQAQAFLPVLYGRVAEISHKLAAADARNRRVRARGGWRKDPTAGILRRELNEANRLIDGLHRRFPQTARQSRVTAKDYFPRVTERSLRPLSLVSSAEYSNPLRNNITRAPHTKRQQYPPRK